MELFKDKKVVIMGLGLHGGGVSAAKFFSKQGAKVLVTDLKSKNQLKDSLDKLKGLDIDYILGEHRKQDFIKTDLIIKNPDVPNNSPFLKIAKQNNVRVKSDLALFFESTNAFIIGITGTKGKSTIATLIYKFLKSKYPRTFLAGNIGISPLELINKTKKGDKVVLELSSFELEDLEQSPQIAVITNILKDHLNRYRGLKDYIEAKKRIFRFQNKDDVLILNYDDRLVRKFDKSASSKVYFYSADKPAITKLFGFLKNQEVFFDKKKTPVCHLKDFKLKGDHNVSNLIAAISVAKFLKVPCQDIVKVLKSFKGVAYRQEFIKEVKGIKYFNDTTATMPDAVIKAVRSLKEKFPQSKIILIAGGVDKNLDYRGLAKEINQNIDNLVLLPGTGSDKLRKGLKGIKIIPVKSMEQAVKESSKIAEKEDIVLLSPGGASFNLFKNEFDRGDQFNKYVKKLK